MAVSRSHLHSSPARRVSSSGALTAAATSVPSATMRRILSPSDPSFAWKVTASSDGMREASGSRRSWSQKKAASASRARTTRSLPSRTLPGSRLSMLATAMNSGISRPAPSSTGKQRW